MSENVVDLDARRKLARTHTKELSVLPAGSSFIVAYGGDALTGAGVLDGDRLSCERAGEVPRGALAVVETPDGLLLRFVFREAEYTRLEAADASAPALCFAHHEARVVGRPTKLVRHFADGPPDESEAA